MKSIIDGFIYDTERPGTVEVLRYSFSYKGDFNFQDFGLFRTKFGHWFIAGTGGPLTRFARPVNGGGWSGGSRIIPLNPSDVLDLVEQLQDEIEVEDVFNYPEISELLETV